MRTPILVLFAASVLPAQPTLVVNDPMPPPAWALAERTLLDAASDGVVAFSDKFVDEAGYLRCVERWGGNDGADDAMENFSGWTLLYALGGREAALERYKHAWEGHLQQYTKARSPGIEMAKNGMYWREFVTAFDWEHTGEALGAFHLYPLARPHDARFKTRVQRFADFYTGDDPDADNYDRDKKIIKSIHNGSRGAKITPASEMDWGGLPVEGDPERLTRYATASNIKGDHPLNLCATALGFNALMASGEKRYRDWALEYLGAWRDRVLENGGNIPTNIGLDGKIGGDWGKWYGGVFGWDFWPQSSGRNYFIRGPRIGFGIALMLTGDVGYMEPLRRQIANLYAAKKIENGRTMLPRKHGDDGWYGYSRSEYSDVQRDIYLSTFDRTSLDGLARDPWIRYLEATNPGYPLEALNSDIEGVRRRVSGLRGDKSIDGERTSDYSQRYNPAQTDSLVKLMLGGNPPDRSGNILHSRLLYFDPERRRVGMPPDVGALVESITADGIRLKLVNLDQVEPRTVIVQSGAYGEHQFGSVKHGDANVEVSGQRFQVRLAPGAGATLQVAISLFKNQPSVGFPWD